MNLTKCKNCGYSIIDEEIENHLCKKVIDYKIENNILWLNDGERWYPQKLSKFSPNFKHPNGTPEDSTEPMLFINIFSCNFVIVCYLCINKLRMLCNVVKLDV
jgi:hypothetical protein